MRYTGNCDLTEQLVLEALQWFETFKQYYSCVVEKKDPEVNPTVQIKTGLKNRNNTIGKLINKWNLYTVNFYNRGPDNVLNPELWFQDRDGLFRFGLKFSLAGPFWVVLISDFPRPGFFSLRFSQAGPDLAVLFWNFSRPCRTGPFCFEIFQGRGNFIYWFENPKSALR